MATITTAIVLDKRRQLSSGEYPVKLVVGFYNGRDQNRRYNIVIDNTKISMTESFFESVMTVKPRGKAKEWRIKLLAEEKRARQIIQSLDPFSFDAFKRRWKESGNYEDVFTWYETKMERLRANEKHGSLAALTNSYNSLKRVLKRQSLPFANITPSLLHKYESKMLEAGKSPNTVSVYLRQLRTLINEAIAEGVLDNDLNPFNRFEISSGSVKKKALNPDQIRALINYHPEEYSTEDMAKDFFFLSYYWKGLNPADIFRIKYSDIVDNQIVIQRVKVKGRRNYTAKDIVLDVTGFPAKVIEKWGQGGGGYIFPVIHDRMSEETKYAKIRTRNRLINKHLGNIAKKIGLEGLAMNHARHSFATALLHHDISVEVISEMLGHSDIKVTKHYLKGISKKQSEEVRKALEEYKPDSQPDDQPGTSSDS